MPASDQATLGAALSAAQAEFPAIERSRTVKVTTKTGGQYSFNYAPLDAILNTIRPVLEKHGLAVSQPLTEHDGRPALETILLHRSGESLRGTFPLTSVPASPQELGSLLTYLRRYALVAILGIATEEDDDGNHASVNRASAQAHGADVRAEETARRPDDAAATSPPAADAAPIEDVITDKQIQRLWTIWRKNELADDVLRNIVIQITGQDSTRQIPKSKYEQVIAAIQEDIPF